MPIDSGNGGAIACAIRVEFMHFLFSLVNTFCSLFVRVCSVIVQLEPSLASQDYV